MGWVADLHGQVVGLDTAPLIYYIEAHPSYLPLVDPFFDAVARGLIQVVTSLTNDRHLAAVTDLHVLVLDQL
ncbi:MAG TPA: hypothetical protein VNL71_00595 [Chloroflexota bacterium]|nr:hypothetical protein [Chloroflexota bacterium]